jgi:hypothetical protein
MSEMSIQASSTHMSGSAGASAGSPAELAYQRAVKAFKRAQQTLAKDLGNRADVKILKVDNVAVQQAAAAVASAQVAVAREKAAAQGQHAPAKNHHVLDSATLLSAAVDAEALVAAHGIVDTYS